MNIKAFHIELNQSLQKIAANTTRKFLSEELDWVINKMQDRFIQNKLQPMVKGKRAETSDRSVKRRLFKKPDKV